MRITNSLEFGNLQQNIETSLENLNTVQEQISTGKKLTKFADDPAGASQSLSLRSALADNTQYQRDADSAKSYLSAADSALSSVNTIIQSARQIAVQGANSSQSPDSLTALSRQVDGIIQQVTQLANTDLHGTYLFGGTQTKTPPYDAAQNYQGNAQPLSAGIGPGYSIQTSTVGSDVFGPAFAALQSLKQHLSDAATGTAGALDGISSDITKVDSGLTAINAAQAIIGAKSDEVNTVKQQLTRAQTGYESSISNIEDVDLASAYVQLQSAQNVYQASLATTAKAAQYSLTDYLH
jgi:flagellar hook-associated protein 3 FlgL